MISPAWASMIEKMRIVFERSEPDLSSASRISQNCWRVEEIGGSLNPVVTLVRGERDGKFVYVWRVPSALNIPSSDLQRISGIIEETQRKGKIDASLSEEQFRKILLRASPFSDRDLDNDIASREVVGRVGFLFGGVAANLRTKLPYYWSDFTDGFNSKVLASIVFIYFACLAPAIAFGGLVSKLTGGELGAAEMLVSTTLCGIIYALFSAQPLTILGSTGPVIVFLGQLFDLCVRLGLPFLPTFGWVGLWTSLILILFAAVEASRLTRWFTRFTDEIFAGLISLIFIAEALGDTLRGVRDSSVPKDTAFLGVILALGTYVIASRLSHFRRSPFLRFGMRNAISDFGPAIALTLMVGVSFLMRPVQVETLALPATFGTTSGRPWLIDLGETPMWARFAALAPALIVSVLLFVDQNVTVRLVNNRRNPLVKGFGYHLDMLVVGVLIGICSLFGLPWMVAATVRSLNHVQSLATVERRDEKDVVTRVRENRVSGLVVHILIGLSLFFLDELRQIPMSVLFGLFLYMGVASLGGNQVVERALLWLTDPKRYPPLYYLKTVPHAVVRKYTLIQLALLSLLWGLKASALGILFPLLIAGLVPIRLMLNRWFDPGHLAHLDAEEDPDQEIDVALGP